MCNPAEGEAAPSGCPGLGPLGAPSPRRNFSLLPFRCLSFSEASKGRRWTACSVPGAAGMPAAPRATAGNKGSLGFEGLFRCARAKRRAALASSCPSGATDTSPSIPTTAALRAKVWIDVRGSGLDWPIAFPGTLVDVRECGRDHCHNGGHPLDCVYGQWKEPLGH